MQGSDSIYIVMPVVVILCLGVLIALPFLGTRDSGGSRGYRPGRGAEEQQAISESPAHQGAAAAITYPDSGDPPSDDGGAQLTSAP